MHAKGNDVLTCGYRPEAAASIPPPPGHWRISDRRRCRRGSPRGDFLGSWACTRRASRPGR